METPSYKKAIVTFFDVLGFKALIDKHSDDPSYIKKIIDDLKQKNEKHQASFLKKIASLKKNPFTEEDKILLKKNKSYFFSDCIVRVQECLPRNNNIFRKEIVLVRNIQSHLATEGIFVRGGITYGDVYYDDNTILGPAMIRAYDLESSYADFPRLLLDRRCEETFEEIFNRILREGKIVKDKDGFYYLDHLKILTRKTFRSRIALRDKIQKHIERNIKQNWKNDRVIRKYHWLSCYYNETFDKQNSEERSFIDIENIIQTQKKDAG